MATLAALLTIALSAKAMSYEQARQQALFLADKMAYELNLTDEQYEAAYEINLDYLMGVNTYDDLYGAYWQQRNLDLSYILLDWQYRAFCDAAYFYRPLYWSGGYWHFAIYRRYPHRDYFFFSRPRVYVSYRGGHSWRHNGGRSWYRGRDFRPAPGNRHFGMRDGYDRGGNGQRGSFGNRKTLDRDNNSDRRGSFGSRRPSASFSSPSRKNFGNRESSTRTTVIKPSERRSASFGNSRLSRPSSSTVPNRTFTPSRQSFGSSRGSSTSVSPSQGGSFGSRGGSPAPSRSNSSSGGGRFGGRR